MQILTYPLGQLQANCYLLVKDRDCLMIDPGDNADFLLEEISRKNLKLQAMLATHGHFDHIMGAGAVSVSTKIPLTINDKDNFLIKRLKESAQYFLGYEPAIIIPETKSQKEGSLKFKNFKLEVLLTPGHTPGSMCFLFKDKKTIFTGDTLFKNAVGRYDFSYGSKKDLYKSIKEKLFTLPEEFVIYPGHGEHSTIAFCRSSIDLR
jgi:glyoxylase-like metal-dependent hydrolase (beta-lactamase superfamily II)